MKKSSIERMRRDWAFELERHQKAALPPAEFPVLRDIPTGRYVDREFYELEQEHLWTKTWLLAGHVDELPDVGSYKLWSEVGPPVVIVRGKDGEIRAFYNTCQHRGGSLVKESHGHANMLVCQYHCWTFDLEGRLKYVPCEHDFPGLDKSERGLVALRCELWGNLIFINRDPQAQPLREFLGPLLADFEDFNLDQVKLVHKTSSEVPANWKVTVDAFQETYHFEQVHPQTIHLMLDGRQNSISLYPNGNSRLIVPKRTDTPIDAQVLDRGRTTGDDRHALTREAARTYMVFPNIIAAPAEFQWFLMAYWPTSPSTSRLDLYFLAPPGHDDAGSPEAQEVMNSIAPVALEDMSVMGAVQQSMNPHALRAMPLSYRERRIYQHHEEIDRVIGVERVPQRYRVEPLLKPFEEQAA